jgi:ATP-binding cassette subfamily F protein uup
MEAASAEIGKLEFRLSDPALYTKEPAAYQKFAAALDAERAKLTAMEEEWLELEMLREELEG